MRQIVRKPLKMKTPQSNNTMAGKIGVVTAICGRKDEHYDRVLSSIKPFADQVVVVCHEYFRVGLADMIAKKADEYGLDMFAIPVPMDFILTDGYAGLWNLGLSTIGTEWIMILALDEEVRNGGKVKEEISRLSGTSADGLYVNVLGDGYRIRLIRKASGIRYSGAIHEEMVLPNGRGQSEFAVEATEIEVVHHRTRADRSIQSLLLIKSFFDPSCRGNCNEWWFTIHLPRLWRHIETDAAKAAAVFRQPLADCIRIPLDWDYWRKMYETWPFEAHQLFYERVWSQYNNQAYGDHQYAVARLKTITKPLTVLELGPWKGEFAAKVLDEVEHVERWYMAEICRSAVANGVRHPKIEWLELDNWPWNMRLPEANCVVAMHVLEHMKAHEVSGVIKNCPTATDWIVEVPVGENENQDWTGYCGTHILEYGWPGVVRLFRAEGFELVDRDGEKAHFKRQL